jgi:RNA polymerase sigma-70 factor (ECF subfamily)
VDDAAVGTLAAFLRHAQPFLIDVAKRLCRNDADVLDLVQDTCEHALRRTKLLPDNPRAWLVTVMHNLFIDRCRASARRPPPRPLDDVLPPPAAPEPVAEPPWTNITLDQVRAAVEELEPAFRDVYVLHVFEHKSYAAIATQLSIQRLTVGTRLTRARQKLRELLVARHGGRGS